MTLAFQELVAPHLRALHMHCYRMLGSLDDADEVTQESLLRAWRGLGGYHGHAPLRHPRASPWPSSPRCSGFPRPSVPR